MSESHAPRPTGKRSEKRSVPQCVTDYDALRSALREARDDGKVVGLVPTMGALHAGHLSLVQASVARCDFTVVTIFVNPTQFGAGEDFDRYPRDLEADLARLAPLGVDLVFAPPPEAMVPNGYATEVHVRAFEDRWEGLCRPGHFAGVATIVLKLFQMVGADFAFFGQKDYQQCRVVQQMVRDLAVPITVTICPIVRDDDGLALSSRNAYLTPDERIQARSLSASLRQAEQSVAEGTADASQVIEAMRQTIEAAGDPEIDYIAVVDAETLDPVSRIDRPVIALLAVHVGRTRLIDNLFLRPS